MRATAKDGPALNVIEQRDHSYAVEEGWGMKAAPGLPDVTDVAVDSADNVYLFCRGDEPIRIFDHAGRMLRSFGQDLFVRPHGLHIGADDTLYCIDESSHSILMLTSHGEVIGRIGGLEPAPFMSGKPLNRCTNVALAMADLDEPIFYVSELGPATASNVDTPNLGPALSILDHKGHHLARLGAPRAGVQPGAFMSPHGVAIDSHGDIYVAELTRTVWSRVYGGPPPAEVRTVVKLSRQ